MIAPKAVAIQEREMSLWTDNDFIKAESVVVKFINKELPWQETEKYKYTPITYGIVLYNDEKAEIARDPMVASYPPVCIYLAAPKYGMNGTIMLKFGYHMLARRSPSDSSST